VIRDDFAGPGGWDEGLRLLGRRDVVGVESDRHACATARAAGHHRVQADVFTVRTRHARLGGYIASPPCQTFSAAGNGAGRAHLDSLVAALHKVADGADPRDAVASVADDELDVRSVLVLHPLTVVRDSRPVFVALEQVGAVQPVWDVYAQVLRSWGYSVDTGKVQAEQYGVPQTRRRAVLLAHLDREAVLPAPTHTRYVKGGARQDGGLLPWVSMADALTWGMTDRPSMTVTGGGTATGGAEPFGNAARQGMIRELEAGRWQITTNDLRGHATVRALEEPAPTITAGKDHGQRVWQPVAAVAGDTSWVEARPSPTIVGSFAADVVAAPGWRKAGDGPRQSQPGSVRVTVAEAAVLQTFPPDYPWQGPKTARHQQVGNAVPPVLAAALLRAVLDAPERAASWDQPDLF
jgi:DNA (cytosine-5)-methyltransferase 1